MQNLIKVFIRHTPLYVPLREWLVRRKVEEWERKGRPVPPPHRIKQNVLVDFARRYDLKILVETGTYRGDMIAAVEDYFERIYSIELSDTLIEMARKRFQGHERVYLIHGDSGIAMGQIMPLLDEPALFWLDGHYSGGITSRGGQDTPILRELELIFEAPNIGHVLIIDDARDFGRLASYPTLEALRAFVNSHWPNAHFSVQDDSIRVVSTRWI